MPTSQSTEDTASCKEREVRLVLQQAMIRQIRNCVSVEVHLWLVCICWGSLGTGGCLSVFHVSHTCVFYCCWAVSPERRNIEMLSFTTT